MRLDLLLIRHHPALSRRKAQDVIEKGQVSVGGERVREPGRDVPETAAVRFDPNLKALPKARSTLPILHEDAHVLVVDKPAGLLSVPSAPGLHEDTVLARVQDYARRLQPHAGYAERVHRLDRDTTGALAFALSREARAGLIEAFRAHRIERRYLAIVTGRPEGESGTIDAPVREAWVSGRRGVARPGEAARPARTHWRLRERLPGAALLEVELETGRQHQVRAHLAHAGLPILGDPVYGPPEPGRPLARRPMLHAAEARVRAPDHGRARLREEPAARGLRERARRAAQGPAGASPAPSCATETTCFQEKQVILESAILKTRVLFLASAAFARLLLGAPDVCAQAPAEGSARKTLTADELWAIQRVGTPVLSPDGSSVAFTVTSYDMDDNRGNGDIWLVPSAGGNPMRLTTSKASDGSPAWSPDGRRIAFVSRRDPDTAAQLYVLPLDGGEPERLTDMPTSVSGPKWLPDGKRIVFVATVVAGAEAPAETKKALEAREKSKVKARATESRLLPVLGPLPAPTTSTRTCSWSTSDEEGRRPPAGSRRYFGLQDGAGDFDVAPTAARSCSRPTTPSRRTPRSTATCSASTPRAARCET